MKTDHQQPEPEPEPKEANRNGLADLEHGADDADATTRAVRDEVQHSAVLTIEVQAVILKDGQIVDLDVIHPAGGAPSEDETQPDSDRYGHPAHCPPNVLDPLPPGACGRAKTPKS